MAILVVLANLTTSAISALFCKFRQITSSIGFDTTWVNFGDFGEFEKFDNFCDILPVQFVLPLVFTPFG